MQTSKSEISVTNAKDFLLAADSLMLVINNYLSFKLLSRSDYNNYTYE